MHNKKPVPLTSLGDKPRPVCPVCGTVSYSLGGVHPQCAERQADAKRVARIKTAKKSKNPKEKVGNPSAIRPWHKICPKCRRQLHVRKRICDCGHQFS